MKNIQVFKDSSAKKMDMCKQHAHRHFEIYYLRSGERKYFIENKVYQLFPGDFALIPACVLHKTNGGTYERVLIHFDEKELPPSFSGTVKNCFSRGVLHVQQKNRGFFEGLLERMWTEYQRNGSSKLLGTYLMALLMEMEQLSATKSDFETPETNYILQVVAYINENFAEDLTVEKLAESVYLSRSHFSRQFKAVTGFAPFEYIHLVRIKAAEALLERTDLSVTEIAMQCGFHDSNYFGDFFRKQQGMSPREWRKSVRKSAGGKE